MLLVLENKVTSFALKKVFVFWFLKNDVQDIYQLFIKFYELVQL